MFKQLILTAALTAAALPAASISMTLTAFLSSARVDRTITNSTTGSTGSTSVGVGLIVYTLADGSLIYTYCIEPQQTTGDIGNTASFNIDPTLTLAPGNIGGMSATRAAAVRLVLGQLSNAFDPGLPDLDQAAMQAALWEVVRENIDPFFSLSSGNVLVTGATIPGVAARAQTFLDAVNRGLGTPISAYALVNVDLQDMVTPTPIPEPATSVLFGLGLAGAAWMSRRRRTA